MMVKHDDFTYAVARIRCKEGKLFSEKNIEQMMSMKDADGVRKYVLDNGWDAPSENSDADLFILQQQELWNLMKEMVTDISAFDFLRVQNDFHNLKVSVKCVYTDTKPDTMFLAGGIIEPYIIFNAVKNRDYSLLPLYMHKPLQSAMSALLQTGDGQLCDTIIDKACIETVYSFGKQSSSNIVKEYCEMFAASSCIKIAIRSIKLSKPADFIIKSSAECESLDVKTLAYSAVKGIDEVCSYLSSTIYRSAIPAIKESLSAFERWCDNHIMSKLRQSKSDPFSIGSLVAYIIAKDTEIKTVRLIMTAKLNDLDDSVIRERIRDMYV